MGHDLKADNATDRLTSYCCLTQLSKVTTLGETTLFLGTNQYTHISWIYLNFSLNCKNKSTWIISSLVVPEIKYQINIGLQFTVRDIQVADLMSDMLNWDVVYFGGERTTCVLGRLPNPIVLKIKCAQTKPTEKHSFQKRHLCNNTNYVFWRIRRYASGQIFKSLRSGFH